MKSLSDHGQAAGLSGESSARRDRSSRRVIVGAYVAMSLAWIFLSDWAVTTFASSWRQDATMQTVKGSFFVVLSGALLWVLLGRHFRRAEQLNRSVRESQVRYRQLIDGAPVAICLVRSGAVVHANDAARRLLGDSPALVGRALGEWVAEGSARRVAELLASAEAHRPTPEGADVQLKNASGAVLEVELTARPFEGNAGQVLVALVDLTERKRVAELMRSAQRMEALASLTGGVVASFNNSLTAMMGHAALGRSLVAGGTGAARAFDQITEVGTHTAGMTRSLMTLCKASPPTKHNENLGEVLADSVEVVRGVLPGAIVVDAEFGGLAGCTAHVDPAQIKHAVLQLALNARDAMPGGGRLKIVGRSIAGPAAGERSAEITVTDTGHGIAAEAIPQLFTGCYSTKQAKSQGGSGLGLAVTRGIVEDHGGTIEAGNEASGGARFRIVLPLVQVGASAPESPEAPAIAGAGRLIILGEDNPQVRSVMVEALRLGGFTVIAAPDGVDVVQAASHNHGRIAALVLDIGMPGYSGVECLARIRAEYPTIPAVLVTGGAKPELSPELIDHTAFLAKPFSVDDLIETVQAMVDPVTRAPQQV